MSYIGRQNLGGAYRQLDDISSGFDGSDTTHTMQVNSQNVTVGDVNQIILSLGGVIQKPGTDFTVSGSVLTFTTAPAANTSFFAVLLGSDNGGTVTPTDSSVTDDKLADTISEINNTGGNLTVDVSGNIVLDADTQGSDNGVLLKDAGTHYGSIFRSGSDLRLKSQASDEDIVFMGNDGGSEITAWTMDMSAGGHLLPGNAATGIYLGVNSATAANLLDDYEVGTFTPTLATTGTNFSSIGYATQTGEYVKVGDLVIAHVRVTLNSFTAGSPSGNAVVSGLPFTSKDTTDMASSIGFVSNINFDISSFGTIDVGATTSANNTRINLTRTRNNGVADGVPHQAVTSSSTSINAVAIYKTA